MRDPEAHASDLIALLQDTAVAVNEMADGVVVRDLSAAVGLPAFSIFGRARELAVSSAVLIDGRRASTALILQRPLFEDAVLLAAIAAGDETDRIRIVARWLLDSYNNIQGLAHSSRRLDPTVDWFPELMERYAKERRQKLATFLASKEVKAAPKFRWEVMARDHGRADSLLDYAVTHQAVHGNEFVHLMVREEQRDGGLLAGKASPYIVGLASSMAIESTLQVMDAAGAIFGIPLPEAIHALRARYAELVAEANGESLAAITSPE